MNRRTYLRAGVALSCGLAGCLDSIGPLSSAQSGDLPCPSTVPRIENADFDGEFRMECATPGQSETEISRTTLSADTQSVSLPNTETGFTLANRHEQHFNANFYDWTLLKHVDGEWHGTVRREVPADAGASLAPGESHTWSVAVSNDDLGPPVDPVRANESPSLRALGGGIYAFVVVGSYGRESQSWVESQPIIGYAAPFTLEGDPLELVPTTTVRDVSRDGDTVTVTVGADDPHDAVTVQKRSDGDTPSEGEPITYLTESVYGIPTLRNALAHFADGVQRVTVRTGDSFGSPLHRGLTFTYEGTTYEVTNTA